MLCLPNFCLLQLETLSKKAFLPSLALVQLKSPSAKYLIPCSYWKQLLQGIQESKEIIPGLCSVHSHLNLLLTPAPTLFLTFLEHCFFLLIFASSIQLHIFDLTLGIITRLSTLIQMTRFFFCLCTL